jgi:hypothetical protein
MRCCCFGTPPKIHEVLNVVEACAFAKSRLPLFLFVDNRVEDARELYEASRLFASAFGRRIWKGGPPWDLPLERACGRVFLVSNPLTTRCVEWDELVCDSPYSLRMHNLRKAEEPCEGRIVRARVGNYGDAERWLPLSNFLSFEVLTPTGRQLFERLKDSTDLRFD